MLVCTVFMRKTGGSRKIYFNAMKNSLYLLIFFLATAHSSAQNTIGGVKITVPEAEVKRQSIFLRAETDFLLGKWDKAVDGFKSFVFDNPDVDAAWYELARAYEASGDRVNALDAIGKAIALAPDNQWYMLYQADLFEKSGRNKDALETYEALVKRHPETPEFYEKLAYLALLNEDPRKALKALDELEQLRGVNEKTTAQKHLIYVGMGDNKKAAAAYQELIDAYPAIPKYRYQLADFYERIGDQANTRKVWEETLRLFPDDPTARMALAGKQSNSEAQYLASLKPLFEDPKVPIDNKVKELVPYLSKLEGGKDPALTQTMTDLGAILEKTHPDEAKAWSLSGDILYLANRGQEALERYRRCIKLNASVFSVWDNTLSILSDEKNYAEMQKTAEQAIDAFPNQPKAYLYYGLAATMQRQYDDALNNLNQALLMTGNNTALRADVLDQMGEAYLGKGDKDKARDAWKKAFDLTKNAAYEQKINAL